MTVKKKGQAMVMISDLILPDDMDERIESELVKWLAVTEKRHGIIHPPLVRKKDKLVIAGRNRVAARLKNGHEDMLVEYADMTNKEAKEVEKNENLFRSHDKDAYHEAVREMQAGFQEEEEMLAKVDERKKPPGRPSSAKNRAIKRTAEATALHPVTVKRIVEKVEAKEVEGPPIHTFGLVVDDKWLGDVRDVQRQLGEVNQKLRRCRQVIALLMESEELPVPMQALSRKHDELKQTAADLKAMYPENLCPGCKGVSIATENCAFCRAAGWVGKLDPKEYDPMLLNEDEPHVWFRGAVVPLDSVLDESPEYEEEEVDF